MRKAPPDPRENLGQIWLGLKLLALKLLAHPSIVQHQLASHLVPIRNIDVFVPNGHPTRSRGMLNFRGASYIIPPLPRCPKFLRGVGELFSKSSPKKAPGGVRGKAPIFPDGRFMRSKKTLNYRGMHYRFKPKPKLSKVFGSPEGFFQKALWWGAGQSPAI